MKVPLEIADTLQPDEVPPPSINDTWLVRGPVFLYNQSLGRLLKKQTPEHIQWEASGEQEAVDEATSSLHTAIAPNANGEARKRRAKAKS